MYKKHVLIFAVFALIVNTTQSQEFSKHTLEVRTEAITIHFDGHDDNEDDDEINGDSGGISISYQLGIAGKVD